MLTTSLTVPLYLRLFQMPASGRLLPAAKAGYRPIAVVRLFAASVCRAAFAAGRGGIDHRHHISKAAIRVRTNLLVERLASGVLADSDGILLSGPKEASG